MYNIYEDMTFEEFYNFESIRERCGVDTPCEECSSYQACSECKKMICTYAGSGTNQDGNLICGYCFNEWEKNL